MKVAVCGGGTGGHTLPVLAVVDSLKKIDKEVQIIFIGSRFGIESQLIPKMGIKYYGISTGKFRRYHKSKILNIIDPTTLIENTRDFFRFFRGIFDARNILAHEKPEVLFAKGGFVSLPVGFAARTLGIPLIIHESDLVMGLSNRWLSKISNKVCVTFDVKKYEDVVKKEKLVETGNPIRADITGGRGDRLRRELGFDLKKKTILIMGGSQGSQFINGVIGDSLENLLEKYQIIWITGERNISYAKSRIKEIPKEMTKNVKLYTFVTTEMADIYSATDLAISRSGSNVIFELAALGIPAIFIPYEVAAGGHQFQNARLFSRSGAAFVMGQKDLDAKKLVHQVELLMENPEELTKMAEKMRSLAVPNAADHVAVIVYKTGEEQIEQAREAGPKTN